MPTFFVQSVKNWGGNLCEMIGCNYWETVVNYFIAGMGMFYLFRNAPVPQKYV